MLILLKDDLDDNLSMMLGEDRRPAFLFNLINIKIDGMLEKEHLERLLVALGISHVMRYYNGTTISAM